jgi:hypothetical protein
MSINVSSLVDICLHSLKQASVIFCLAESQSAFDVFLEG